MQDTTFSQRGWPALAAICLAAGISAAAAKPVQWVISGNETKIGLTTGAPRVVEPDGPDSLTFLDFAQDPPRVAHLEGVSNTVIGPPSNIAISPDGGLALVADSIRLDPAAESGWAPERSAHLLDLSGETPRLAGRVETGAQPSGISFTPDGRRALVANRAEGSLTVLRVEGTRVLPEATVPICEPEESLSDVAVSPDGALALASVQKGGYLAVLRLTGEGVAPTGRKLSVYGQPYRVVITPDGRFGLTAGQGFGNGVDSDALSVVDLAADPIRTVDHVVLGAVPESIEVSPDGRLVAAVLMEGSNLPADDPGRRDNGQLVILRREGDRFAVRQRLRCGPIPEGVAFTADGRLLLVQSHPERSLWVYAVGDREVTDTGRRIALPGMGASLRAAR